MSTPLSFNRSPCAPVIVENATAPLSPFERHPCASPLIFDATPTSTPSHSSSPAVEPAASISPVVRQALRAAVSFSSASNTSNSTPSPSFSHSSRSEEHKADRYERKVPRFSTLSPSASSFTPKTVTVVQNFYFGSGAGAPSRVSAAQYPWAHSGSHSAAQHSTSSAGASVSAAAPSAFVAPVRPLAARATAHTSLPLSSPAAFTPIHPAAALASSLDVAAPSSVSISDVDSRPDVDPGIDASPYCLTLNPPKASTKPYTPSFLLEASYQNAVFAEIGKGEYGAALEKLDRCIEYYPTRSRFRHLQLHLFQLMGTLRPSPSYFIKTARDLLPDCQWRWLLHQAQYYADLDERDEALQTMELAERRIPKNHQSPWRVSLQKTILLWQFGAKLPEMKKIFDELLQNKKINPKHRHDLIILIAGIYQLFGDISPALKLLDEHAQTLEAANVMKPAWHIRMEQVYALIHAGLIDEGEKLLLKLEPQYRNQGRYWMLRIQLCSGNTLEEVLKASQLILESARDIESVRKSGEMLCEYARFLMNPTKLRPSANHPCYIEYNLDLAQQALEKAIEITPQYAESYIELMRLYKIKGDQVDMIQNLKERFLKAPPNFWGVLYSLCVNSSSHEQFRTEIWKIAEARVDEQLAYLKTTKEDGFDSHVNAFGISYRSMFRQIANFTSYAQRTNFFVKDLTLRKESLFFYA